MIIPPRALVAALPEMSPAALPPDIQAFEKSLQTVKETAGKIRFWADGLVAGVGLDAMIGLVPVVGEVFTIGATTWLVVLAGRAKLPVKDRAILIGAGAADAVLGIYPLAGDFLDVFFRSHAWGADRIIAHVDAQLADIDTLREHLTLTGTPVPADHAALLRLRGVLAV